MNDYNKEHEKDAVQFYRSDRTAILSTISKKHKGYPFGSFVSYISGWDRTLFLYLSAVADHTKNLKNDHKSCITIFKKNNEGDIQNSARLTLIGDLEVVSDNINERCKDRFHKIFPESEGYAKMHNFNFYQITIIQARWIGGFGKISWLDPENWSRIPIEWYNNEQRMIEHMNEDHTNAIKSALHAQHGIKDHEALMLALSIDGYYIRSKNDLFFINFDRPVFSSRDYREMLIGLSKKYRSYEI